MAEKQEMCKYIQSIPQFSSLDSDIIEQVTKKIRVQIYYPGELIQEIEEKCKFILILYDGKVSRINKDYRVESQQKNVALNTNLVRKEGYLNDFSLKAENNCIVFALKASDLEEIENDYAHYIMNEFQTILTMHDFFHSIESKSVKQIATQAKGKLLFPGENLYKIGEPSKEIYFIYFGKIEKKKLFYSEERNRWPVKKNNKFGEDEELSGNYGYRIFTKNFTNSNFVGKMDFFGDQEAIYEVGRRTEANAVEPTFLLWLDRKTFLNILTIEDLNLLSKYRAQKPIKLSPDQSPEYYFKLEKKNKYQKERILGALDVLFTHENNLNQLQKLEKRIEPFKQQILHKFDVKNKMNTTTYQ